MIEGSLDWPRPEPLASRVETTPEKTALIDVATDRRWTYREFDRHVDYTTSNLETVFDSVGARTGCEESDPPRLATLVNTRPAFVRLFFAAIRAGTVLVPLTVRETPAELSAKIDRTEPCALICEGETESIATESTDRPIFSVDEPSGNAPERVTELGGEGGTDTVESTSLERDDLACIMFTSGTTGVPKGVRLTIGNLLASATASAFRLGVLPTDRWLCCLPTYHMGGLAPVVRSTLYGTTLVVQQEFDPERTARALAEYDITGVSLVPTMLERLLADGWEGTDSLRIVLLGGAPPTNELLELAFEAGIPVFPTYGTTETSSQIATATPEEVRSDEGTVGHPLFGTEVTIVDETTTPVDAGEWGEVVVSGPTVTPGYIDAERTAEAFCEYGLQTGDFGYRDRDGRLWIGERRTDRIVTGGENVDPSAVANSLETHPAVNEAIVVSLPDPEWGERVAAAVVSRPGREISVSDLLEHCTDRLAGFKQPKTIGKIDSLPRTASGTVDRDEVREFLRENGIDTTDLE